MSAEAFDPHDTIPAFRDRRLSNMDFVGYGGPVDEMVKKVIAHTNTKIAPAVISERFYKAEDQQALEFHGRWGTFRVRFRIASHMLDRAYQGPAWLAAEMEHLMADAINSALQNLVREQMQTVVQEGIDRELRAFKTDLAKEKQRLLDEIDEKLERRRRWYHKAWSRTRNFLLRPVW